MLLNKDYGKKLKSVTLFALLSLTSSLTAFVAPAQAEIDYIVCNICSDAKMKLSAQKTSQDKIVNVVDFIKFTSKSYLIYTEGGERNSREVAAHPDIIDGLVELKAAKAYIAENFSNEDLNAEQLIPYLLNKASVNDFIKVIRFQDRQADIANAVSKYYQQSFRPDALKNPATIFGTSTVFNVALPIGYLIKILLKNLLLTPLPF